MRRIEIALKLWLALRAVATLSALHLRTGLRTTAIIETAAALRRCSALGTGSARLAFTRTSLRAGLHAGHRRRADALKRFLDVLDLLGRELRAKFVNESRVEISRALLAGGLRFARSAALGLHVARLALARLAVAGRLAFAADALGFWLLRLLPVLRLEAGGGERGAKGGGGCE